MSSRRLIGPTLVSLAMLGLWLDYLFFSQSPWSATKILGKILGIFGGIFAPLFDPKHYAWADAFLLPALAIFFVVVLLSIIVARAKVAMKQATPHPQQYVPLSPAKPKPAGAPAVAEEQPLPRRWPKEWHLGYRGKLVAYFAVLSAIFGASAIVVVYPRLGQTLEREIKRRADVAAIALGELARRNLASKSQAALEAAMDDLASQTSVAYVYVEDAAGQIIAHRPRELLIHLRRDFPKSAERALKGVELDYRGLTVYEVATRVGDGKGGYAHLAIWRDVIEEELRHATAPIAAWMLVVMSLVTALFAWLIRLAYRPLMELIDNASRISKGELDLEAGTGQSGEAGDLGRSFDVMRFRMRAVLSQLEEAESLERSREGV